MMSLSASAFRWLPVAAAAASLAIIGLAVVGLAGIGNQAGDHAMGDKYVELLQAVRSPALHRVEMFFDVAGWLTSALVIVLLGAAVSPWAPGRAAVIAICGVGQLVGAQGGFERWIGISDLAAAYSSAAVDQQPLIAQSFITLLDTIRSHFHEGQLLQAVGFLLASWALIHVPGFPRWLALVVGLPGVTSTLLWLGNSILIDGVPFFPYTLAHVLIFVLGANVALAVTLFRQPQPARSGA